MVEAFSGSAKGTDLKAEAKNNHDLFFDG